MAWHRIDYDGLWSSDKLSRCSDEAQADYAWVYGIADAWGCFELTNMRVILGRVSPIRKKLTLERLEATFGDFGRNGLCFTWALGGKRFGYWTGCETRLPAPSIRNRYARSTPEPPREDLERYIRSFGSPLPENSLDPVATTSRLDRDNVTGTGTETGTNPSAPRPAAESGGQTPELPFETSQRPALYSSHDHRFPPFLALAMEQFRLHFSQTPTWRRRDHRSLDGLLAHRRDLSVEELSRRWANFLQSTEPYISSQGGSLEFFCRNFDRFIQGPQIAVSKQGGTDHAEQRTLNNLRAAGFKVVG